MNRRAFLVAGTCLLAAPARAGDWPVEPRAIVEKLYSFYAKGSDENSTAFVDAGVRRRYFSRSLTALVNRAEAKSRRTNEPVIDFDPIIGGQDWDAPKELNIVEENADAQKTTLRARFKVFDAQQETTFDFVREGGAWKIFDIRGDAEGQKWSLREIAQS